MHISRAITAVAGCTTVGKYQTGKAAVLTNHQGTISMTKTRKRASAPLACVTAFVGASVLAGTLAVPIASADSLPNGLTVSCNQDSDIHMTCIVGGCPRVNGDHVVDTVHIKVDGGAQEEGSFKCISGETHREGFDNRRNPVFIGVQACRKNFPSSDDCTPYANYTFQPPAKPAAPAPAAPVPAAPAPVITPPNAAPAPLKNPTAAPTPGVTGVTFHVTDHSGVASHCTYSSEGFTSDTFALPANGSFDLVVPAIREFKTRTGTITCDNGTSVPTSVTF